MGVCVREREREREYFDVEYRECVAYNDIGQTDWMGMS